MPNKTETLIQVLRRSPMFAQLVPMEAAAGWPWPRVTADRSTYVAIPFFGMARAGEGRFVLYPPFAQITVRWRNGLPVEYLNLRFSNPWPEADWTQQAGTFPHPAVAELSGPKYSELRTETLGVYGEIFDLLDAGEKVPAQLKERLVDLLRRLIEPGLAPFYLKLAPAFFASFIGAK